MPLPLFSKSRTWAMEAGSGDEVSRTLPSGEHRPKLSVGRKERGVRKGGGGWGPRGHGPVLVRQRARPPRRPAGATRGKLRQAHSCLTPYGKVHYPYRDATPGGGGDRAARRGGGPAGQWVGGERRAGGGRLCCHVTLKSRRQVVELATPASRRCLASRATGMVLISHPPPGWLGTHPSRSSLLRDGRLGRRVPQSPPPPSSSSPPPPPPSCGNVPVDQGGAARSGGWLIKAQSPPPL